MSLHTEDYKMIASAVGKAMKAYNKDIERKGVDPSFFPISITVHVLTVDFEEISQILYKEMDFKK